MENLYKFPKIISAITLLLSASSCLPISTVGMPKSFSECPDINGTYNNVNRYRTKEVRKLGTDVGDGKRMDTLFNNFGNPQDAFISKEVDYLREYRSVYYFTMPGLVHVFWLDKGKTYLAMILDVDQLGADNPEYKTPKQKESILFSKYYVFQNESDTDLHAKAMPDLFSLMYCNEGKLKYSYGYTIVTFGVVRGDKGEFIFYLDKDGNLNSELTWSARREMYTTSTNNLDTGFWANKEPSVYQINQIYPSSQIAAILANIYIGLYKKSISINSVDGLADIRMNLMQADIELRGKEDHDKACEHLDAAAQHRNAVDGDYAEEIFDNIEVVKKNLQCDKKSSHSPQFRIN